MDFDVIQVGAHIGKGDRVFDEVEAGNIRSGILLEPIPGLFDQLKRNYEVFSGDFRFVNAALHPTLKEATLEYVTDVRGLPDWSCAIGSMVPRVKQKHIQMIEDLSGRTPEFSTITVPCVNFDDLFFEYSIESVESLYIDTEGMDKEVLMNFPFHRCLPKRIVFEHAHLEPDDLQHAMALLSGLGYELRVDGIDYIADLSAESNDGIEHQRPLLVGGALLPDKQEDIITISNRFRRDLIDFFEDIGRHMCIVEIGAYLGYSTRLLASLFRHVISVDVDPQLIEWNRNFNADLANVEYVELDVYSGDWSVLAARSVDAVMIDANHEYHCVVSDIDHALKTFHRPIIVFDDYGAWPGVKQAVDDYVARGILKVLRHMGHEPGWYIRDYGETSDWEGIVCEAV